MSNSKRNTRNSRSTSTRRSTSGKRTAKRSNLRPALEEGCIASYVLEVLGGQSAPITTKNIAERVAYKRGYKTKGLDRTVSTVLSQLARHGYVTRRRNRNNRMVYEIK
jgi:hypothetical protein